MKKYLATALFITAILTSAAPLAYAAGTAPELAQVVQSPKTGVSGSSGLNGGGSGFSAVDVSGLSSLGTTIIVFINAVLVPLLIAVAFILFLYGVANAYIFNGANEEKRAEGHRFILWSIIGFVVIFSLWGFVNLIIDSLNLPASQTHPNYPTL